MILSDVTSFLGRFHPLIVHLPIGIFILAFLFDIISYHKNFSFCRQVVPLIILTGFIFSILSVLLGFLLSFEGDYDRNTLGAHRNAGIALTILTGLLYLLHLPRFRKRIKIPHFLNTSFMILMIVFLVYTGHQGANLTHGSDYIDLRVLTETKRERPENINDVLLYEDVVQPILSKKCTQCHRQGKKKGRLSLESIADMKKGGKTGPGIVEGKSDESEIIHRILLDPDHEDFMPADGKPPLTKNETSILKWWVDKGMAAKEEKFLRLKDASEINGAVSTFLQLAGERGSTSLSDDESQIYNDVPDTINMTAIENLRKKGINVRVMHQRPMLLDVSLLPGSKDKLLASTSDLNEIAGNIIWLNLSDNGLTAGDLKFLPAMKNLMKLRLEKNDISNDICALVTPLTKLEAVNLNETKVSEECLDVIVKMPSMKNVYSWRSGDKKL